jgi:hypothetical protein
MAYPIVRRLQRQFARDSMHGMWEAVKRNDHRH